MILVFSPTSVRHAVLKANLAVVFMSFVLGTIMNAQRAPVPEPENTKPAMIDTLLNRLVTVHVTDVSRSDALKAISSQTNILIQYRTGLLASFKGTVTIQVDKVPLRDVIGQVLAGTRLKVVSDSNGRLVIVETLPDAKTSRTDATGTVTGIVLDSASGQRIPGATVTISGTKLTSVTDLDGAFMMKLVPVGSQTVVVKMLGYISVKRSVRVSDNQQSTLRIALRPNTTTLSEVVTTATGMQRKIEVGNAITSINVDSVMRVAPIQTLTDLLESRVPGLTVQRTSGAPGDPSRLRLRGAASVTGNNDPIVIVDGVRVYAAQSDIRNTNLTNTGYAAPSPLDQIDPNSIETIDVFKGPSASSMYGSDAANGVIVITTKRGRAGPARWTASINQGVAYIPGKYPVGLFRFGSSIGQVGASGRCSIFDLLCQLDSVVRFQALNDPKYTVLGTGLESGVSTSVSGGTQALQYAVTASGGNNRGLLKLPSSAAQRYKDILGSSPPSWMHHPDLYRTWSGEGTVTAQINPALQIGFTSALFNSNQHRSSLGLGAIPTLMAQYIDPVVFNTSELIKFYEKISASNLNSTHTARLNWRVTPWLPVTATAGLNIMNRMDEAVIPRGASPLPIDSLGAFSIGRGSAVNRSFALNGQIPTWGDYVTSMIGLNLVNESITDIVSTTGDQGIPNGVSRPTLFSQSTERTSGRTTFGWFIEPRINVKSRFFVMPGFRLDNNGLAGSDAKLMGLPKMNFSWVASDESFFPLQNIISLFRLRAGFGTAGVQPGPTARLRLFSTLMGNQNLAEFYGNSIIMTQLGNTQLRPERSTEFEGGFDADLWNGRLRVEMTGYRKVRHDAIVSAPLAPSVFTSGSNYYNANIGVVRNTGGDMTLNAQLIESQSVGWQMGFSVSQNDNLVTRLNAGQTSVMVVGVGVSTRVTPGYPLFGRWANPIVGYADADGDGRIIASEVVVGDSAVYLGRSEPKNTMALSNNLTMFGGRIQFNTQFSYTGAMAQYNEVMSALTSPLNLAANDPNAPFAQQAAAAASAVTPYGLIQTVTTFRFQSASASYVVNPALARRLGARNMTLALQGSNLWLRTGYRGKDPNVNSVPYGNDAVDGGALPQPRTWSLRIMLGN